MATTTLAAVTTTQTRYSPAPEATTHIDTAVEHPDVPLLAPNKDSDSELLLKGPHASHHEPFRPILTPTSWPAPVHNRCRYLRSLSRRSRAGMLRRPSQRGPLWSRRSAFGRSIRGRGRMKNAIRASLRSSVGPCGMRGMAGSRWCRVWVQ